MPVFFSEKSPRNPEACLVPRFGCCNYSCKPHCSCSSAIIRFSWYSRPRAANRLNRSSASCKAPNGATCKQAASHELEQKPKRGRQHHIYSFENVTMPESSSTPEIESLQKVRATLEIVREATEKIHHDLVRATENNRDIASEIKRTSNAIDKL